MDVKENEMLRTEILKYLGEYQEVRNMMYVVTAALFGVGVYEGPMSDVAPAFFLLPLIVIFPTYIIALDYWRGVEKAATYLQVFYEEEEGAVYHWETRTHKLRIELPPIVRVNCQLIPYVVCAISCLILYFMNMDIQNCRHWIVGIAALTANVWVWKKVKKSDRQEYLTEWRRIKKEERQSS